MSAMNELSSLLMLKVLPSSSLSSTALVACVCGLLFVIYRALFITNRPTLETTSTGAKNNLERLLTAAIYVPLVPTLSIYWPAGMTFFMGVMVVKGLGEYAQIMKLQTSEEKRKEMELKEMKMKKKTKENEKEEHQEQVVLSSRIVVLDHTDRWLQIQGALVVAASWAGRLDIHSTSIFFCFISLLIYHMLLISKASQLEREVLARLSLHLFGFLWIAWTSTHTVLLLNMGYEYGGGLISLMLCTSWIGDGAAFYIGKKFGRHKAFPTLSPSKTWEGIVATTALSLLLCIGAKNLQLAGFTVFNLPPISMSHYVALGVIISAFDIVGDICESFVKRLGGVKDSGTFFTGHGGVCDRFDSFYFVCPITLYYFYYVIL